MTNGHTGNGKVHDRVEWMYRSVIIVALTLVGFWAQQTWQDMRTIEGKLIKIEVELARNYVTREEFRDRIKRLEKELDDFRHGWGPPPNIGNE